MKIALDYDGTFTADKALWTPFVQHAKANGHEIKFVTYRDTNPLLMKAFQSNDDIEADAKKLGIDIIYTCNQPKRKLYQADIWIDDNPELIFEVVKF